MTIGIIKKNHFYAILPIILGNKLILAHNFDIRFIYGK